MRHIFWKWNIKNKCSPNSCSLVGNHSSVHIVYICIQTMTISFNWVSKEWHYFDIFFPHQNPSEQINHLPYIYIVQRQTRFKTANDHHYISVLNMPLLKSTFVRTPLWFPILRQWQHDTFSASQPKHTYIAVRFENKMLSVSRSLYPHIKISLN